MYYIEMVVGSTYELQFVDPTTGDVLSLDDYDWLEDVDGVTVNGNIVTVTPTETGEVWIIGPAGVMVSYVSADAETTTTTTSGSVNTSDLSVYVLIAFVMILGASGIMIAYVSLSSLEML